MTTVLVATDFSARSDRGIRRAVLVARTTGAALLLAHVIDDDQPRALIDAEEKAASQILRETARSLRDELGAPVEVRILRGEPFEALPKLARETGASLLVLGPHRREILRDVFTGTTAERTVRSATRPVLMANAVPSGPYKKALCAVDFSEASALAARSVLELGLVPETEIVLMHAFVPPGEGLLMRTGATEGQIASYVEEERRRAAGEMAAFVAAHGFANATWRLRQAQETIGRSIADAAEEAGAGLVVLGTRKPAGLSRLLLGSVADELFRLGETDVLAVPPRAGDGEAALGLGPARR